jgi:hypothetical protein
VKGIQYFFDKQGEPAVVVIDLKKHGKLWEDFQDLMVARSRLKEPRIPFEKVVADLPKKGKIA